MAIVDAHRVALALELGRPIKKGYFSCHTCDTPSCISSNCLFEGTAQDNSADMISKGRQSKGVNQFSCKLTEQQVLEIRNRYLIGSKKISHAELAKDYGVSTSTILSIISRETWKHI